MVIICILKLICSLDMTKVLVIGGYDDASISYFDDVEVVDLTSEASNCGTVSNYPFEFAWSVGTTLEGTPTVCGGYNADAGLATNECYQYVSEENRWFIFDQSLLETRFT